MKILYTEDGTIAAVGDIIEGEAEFVVNGDSHLSKNLALTLAEVDNLPADFSANRYEFKNGAFSRKPPPPAALAELKKKRSDALEAAVMAVYEKPTTLAREYEQREANAKAYKEAGYAGNAGRFLTGFATKAKLSLKDAADLVLQQASVFRDVEPALADLRMVKYEIAAAKDEVAVETIFGNAMTELKGIVARIA